MCIQGNAQNVCEGKLSGSLSIIIHTPLFIYF